MQISLWVCPYAHLFHQLWKSQSCWCDLQQSRFETHLGRQTNDETTSSLHFFTKVMWWLAGPYRVQNSPGAHKNKSAPPLSCWWFWPGNGRLAPACWLKSSFLVCYIFFPVKINKKDWKTHLFFVEVVFKKIFFCKKNSPEVDQLSGVCQLLVGTLKSCFCQAMSCWLTI